MRWRVDERVEYERDQGNILTIEVKPSLARFARSLRRARVGSSQRGETRDDAKDEETDDESDEVGDD